MKSPIAVTFDTNTYSTIADPKIGRLLEKWRPLSRDRLQSKKRRICTWYIQHCIRKGRIYAAIPEAAFAAESLRNEDRVDLLLSIGTRSPPPAIPATRQKIIADALKTGFRIMHGPRIGYGAQPNFSPDEWASDTNYSVGDRQDRMSKFIRHFGEYALNSLRDLGERLSLAHGLVASNQQFTQAAALTGISLERYLWCEGIQAEALNPTSYPTQKEFLRELRKLMADWADFDIAATHYAYGYDLICTEDQGKLVSNSIFGPTHYSDVSNMFDVRSITLMALASLCWQRFRFPLCTWQTS